MPTGASKRAALAVAAVTLALPAVAQAAGPPQIAAAWTTDVSSASVTFHGEVNPEGKRTTYRFEYETEAAWQANPPAERFKGASKAPISSFCPGAVSNGCAGAAVLFGRGDELPAAGVGQGEGRAQGLSGEGERGPGGVGFERCRAFGAGGSSPSPPIPPPTAASSNGSGWPARNRRSPAAR